MGTVDSFSASAVEDAVAPVREADLDDLLRELLRRVGQVVDDQERLKLLLDAVVSMAADLSLDSVLHRIVTTASELAGAEYAALGVLGFSPDRRLEAFVTHGMSEQQRARIGDLPNGQGILGLIIDQPEPVRLHDLTTHPASYGFPAEHPPMNSFLGVPIRIRGKVFGNLYLTEKRDGGDFTEQDEVIVVALAAAAGVVIENARLYAEAARRERWLEATAEITALLLGRASQDEALRAVADRAREIARADISTVSLRQGDEFEVLVVSGVEPGTLPRMFNVQGSIAGGVLDTGVPAVVEDLSTDPRSKNTSFGEHGPTLGPAIIVPLRTRDGIVGVLSLGWYPDHRVAYQEVDVQLPRRFAEQAALALEVARARSDHERLLLFEDRDRIGRDLHDLVIQRLFAIGLNVQNTARLTDNPDVADRMNQAVDEIDVTIKDIRRAIYALNTHDGSPELSTTISEVISQAAESLGFSPRLHLHGSIDTADDPSAAEHLIAVLREALSNVIRHSKATEVAVTVVVDQNMSLTVSDNGVGIPDDAERTGGLQNMRERADNLLGHCDVTSNSHGTTVSWVVPCGGVS